MRAFVGFGELGRQVEALLPQPPRDDPVVYFDDPLTGRGHASARPFAEFVDDRYRDYEFYVCLGYQHLETKSRLVRELMELGRRVPAFIHDSCQVSASAAIGSGALVYPMCVLDKDVSVGDGALINNSVTVSHNAAIGTCAYLSPGVVLCGYVRIGAQTFVGAGAVISDGVTVGDGVKIGVGTVVTQDIPPGASVIGNPMRILDRQLDL